MPLYDVDGVDRPLHLSEEHAEEIGAKLHVPEPEPEPSDRVNDVLARVDTGETTAADALQHELAKPESERRSSLVSGLEQRVAADDPS